MKLNKALIAFPVARQITNAVLSGYLLMAVTISIQFLLIPKYLTLLGQRDFGILVQILAFLNYAAIGLTGVSGSMARILGEYASVKDITKFGKAYLFSKIIYVFYALIIVILSFAILFIFFPNIFNDEKIKLTYIFFSVYLILLYEFNTDRLSLNALRLQTLGNIFEIIGQIVFGLTVLLLLSIENAIYIVPLAMIAGVLTTRLLVGIFWFLKKEYNKIALPERNFVTKLWHRIIGTMGINYTVYGFILLTLNADILILGFFADSDRVALYYLVWRIPEAFVILLWRVPAVFEPYFIELDTRGDFSSLENTYKRGHVLILFVAALLAIFYIFFGSSVVNYWTGQNLNVDDWNYWVCGVALFFISTARWPIAIASSLVNLKPLIYISSIELMAKVSLIYVFSAQQYIVAPALAVIITHSVIYWAYIWLGKETLSSRNKLQINEDNQC